MTAPDSTLPLEATEQLHAQLTDLTGPLYHGAGATFDAARLQLGIMAASGWPVYEHCCTFLAGQIGDHLRTMGTSPIGQALLGADRSEHALARALAVMNPRTAAQAEPVAHIAFAAMGADIDTVKTSIDALYDLDRVDRALALAGLLMLAVRTHTAVCAGGRW